MSQLSDDREIFWAVLTLWLALRLIASLGQHLSNRKRDPIPAIRQESPSEHENNPSEPSWQFIEKVVLAEGADQGFNGMQWIACTMRNRRWNLDGYAGAKRRDLRDFVRQQPEYAHRNARAAIQSVREGFSCQGATHFENVGAFGSPPWTKKMIVVRRVGDHTFYRQR